MEDVGSPKTLRIFFSLVLGLLTILIIDNIDYTRDWSNLTKILCAVGVTVFTFILFIAFQKNKPTEQTANKKTFSEKVDALTSWTFELLSLALFIGLICLIILAIPISVWIRDNSPPPTKFKFGLTFDNDRYTRDLAKTVFIDKDRTYSPFDLDKDQHWQMYFDYPIEWRIVAPNETNPSFVKIKPEEFSGKEFIAPIRGRLEIRSFVDHNCFEYYRLVKAPK